MLVCLHEDRTAQIAGVKLLLLSLEQHCPDWQILLNFPGAPAEFRSWLGRFRAVRLTERRSNADGSFNVKPDILLAGLETGAERCLWLDTDVLVARRPSVLCGLPEANLAISEDPWIGPNGSSLRAARWGMKPAGSVPGPMNTAVLSVTGQHRGLLEKWQALLQEPWYREEQRKPVEVRDALALGDQDALSALLGSAEFAHVPLTRLRHAREVLHHHGAGAYRMRDRWQTLRWGTPPLLHAMGGVKPWMSPDLARLRSPRQYYERYYLEASPYMREARRYLRSFPEGAFWMKARTLPGRVSTRLGVLHPAFSGAMQALLHEANRWWRSPRTAPSS